MLESPLVQIDPWLAPHNGALLERRQHLRETRRRIVGNDSLVDFAQGHHYFGLHRTEEGWVFREWLPHATAVYLIGEFSAWQDDDAFQLAKLANGVWELTLPPAALAHAMLYKLHVHWNGGEGERIPAYATRVVQDPTTHIFSAQVWSPDGPYRWLHSFTRDTAASPYIYEAHIGMSGEDEKVTTYAEFMRDTLPRVIAAGYTTIQLMAIQEHPYYGSFGYHVSSFFAASSRFGTPEELKALIDAAHGAGIAVILDLVHSHAVKNESEGLSRQDGSLNQYFHAGARGTHAAWDSRLFDYGKPEVMHFLLSNCRYWLEEYHFDGFRFDGVTSMLYDDHGLGRSFSSYDTYFSHVDADAAAYLALANQLIHEYRPNALTIAEEVSGMPGLAAPVADDGLGFDYRLNMGAPDNWIKLIKDSRDEDWSMSQLLHELAAHRPEEHTISYAESHDQALVGDKTLLFRLADSDMYTGMSVGFHSPVIDRAIALHKMIRLLTASLHHGGYLNFMGNEFGHPEWIDFPREGNEWSYKYARRQWRLVDDPALKYHQLNGFDKAMIALLRGYEPAMHQPVAWTTVNDSDHTLSFMRGELLFVFNFHPVNSYEHYDVDAPVGQYETLLTTDDSRYGGFDSIDPSVRHTATAEQRMTLYAPARTGMILRRV